MAAVYFGGSAILFWSFVGSDLFHHSPIDLGRSMFVAVISALLTCFFGYHYVLSRVRLDESGVRPNRRGHPDFVPWRGSYIWQRGYSLFVRGEGGQAEIHLATFCSLKPLHAFIDRKIAEGALSEGQPAGLIRVLLDERAAYGDRDDAAMDLGGYDGDAVERALAQIACDPKEEEGLADSCGQSLAELWNRRDGFDTNILLGLTPVALRIAIGTLQGLNPALADSAQAAISDKRAT